MNGNILKKRNFFDPGILAIFGQFWTDFRQFKLFLVIGGSDDKSFITKNIHLG